MYFANMLVSIVLMISILAEIYLIITRNRKVIVKGSTDLMLHVIILAAAVIIFPLSSNFEITEAVRDILLFAAIFGSAAVKRGIFEKGIVRFFCIIAWDKIQSAKIEEYQATKIAVLYNIGKREYRLIFHKPQLKSVLFETEKHIRQVTMQESLQAILNNGRYQ